MKIKILLCILFALLGIVIWTWNGDQQPEVPAYVDKPAKPRQSRPKPKADVQIPVESPAIPKSVIPGEEDKFVENARTLLAGNIGAARAQAWADILPQANFDQLVKLTEIVAQPKLDEERTQLRRAVVEQMAATGTIAEFIQLRQNFDKGFSLVQIMAWEIWARTAPAETLAAWHTRLTSNPPNEGREWWLHSITSGLKAAPKQTAVQAVRALPESHRGYFPKELQ